MKTEENIFIPRNTNPMHRILRIALTCIAFISHAPAPALAIQTFSGGIVQGEKTLSDPNLTQSGTIELNGAATLNNPITVTIPFVNTGTVNPSLWAVAPEVNVSLLQAEGNLTGGYSLTVSNINHNTFTLSIRPNTRSAVLRKIVISYIAVGRHS